jgi:hypothetical protein
VTTNRLSRWFFSLNLGNGIVNPLLASFGFDGLVDAPDDEILPSGREGFEVARGACRPQGGE